MKKTTVALSIITIFALSLCACGTSKPSQPESQATEAVVPGGGIVAGVDADNFPILLGSTANIPLMSKLYSEVCGVSVEDANAVMNTQATTSTAWESILESTDDRLLIVYEAPKSIVENMYAENLAFEVTAIGRDGLVFLVNKNNPVENLTREQLVQIYTGKATDWSQVGAGSGEITPFQRNETSGSQTMFLKLLMKDTQPMNPPSELVPAMMGALIDGVAAYDGAGGAIGYSVYYYANLMYQNPDIKLINVDGIAPSNQSIADESYPLTNEFYAVIRKELPTDSPARKLRDYLLTADGKKLIQDAGYVALAGEKS